MGPRATRRRYVSRPSAASRSLPELSSIVLTGKGRAFSAGGTIPGFIRDFEDLISRRESFRGARRLLDAMAKCPKPIIAAVNGPAVGLGCSVAVRCDIVFIANETYVSDTHVSIGLVAESESFTTDDIKKTIDGFKKQRK